MRSRRVRLNIENVPHVFIGAFERTESKNITSKASETLSLCRGEPKEKHIVPYWNAEKSLPVPVVGGSEFDVAHRLRLAAVNDELNRFLCVFFQQLPQRVIVLVLSPQKHSSSKCQSIFLLKPSECSSSLPVECFQCKQWSRKKLQAQLYNLESCLEPRIQA